MGRISTFTGMALAAAAFVSAPAMAQDAGLACFENQYSEDQQSQIASLAPEAGAGVAGVQALVGQVAQIVQPTFAVCAASEGWSQEQTQHAATYEIGRLSTGVIRGSEMLTEDELARFDAALSNPANAPVMTAMENIVRSSMGGGTQPTFEDQELLGNFITNNSFDIGFAGTDTAELISLLLSFMAVQNIGASEFAGAQGGAASDAPADAVR